MFQALIIEVIATLFLSNIYFEMIVDSLTLSKPGS